MDNKNTPLPIGCIVMASGEGRRFGGNKLLAPFKGGYLLEAVLSAVSQINFAAASVITRSREIDTLCRQKNINCTLHSYPGQDDTVRLGMKSIYSPQLLGYLFCVGDQPLLSAATLNSLCRAFLQDPEHIYRPAANGKPGNPVIFPKKYASELMQLPQDKGGSYLTKKYSGQVRLIPVRNAYELYDIDTAEDLQHLEMLTF